MSSWRHVALGEIFDITRGGSPRPIDSYITTDPSGINWILIGDATEGSKYITSTKKRIRPDGVRKSRPVKPGDFLLSNSMSFGRPYIVKTTGCVHDGWLVLSPRDHDVDADFFYHLLSSKSVYAEFERRASGATVKNLNTELVSGVEVPLPPLLDQRRIAAILDKADALRAKRRAAIGHVDGLQQAIFLDLFGDPIANPRGWTTGVTLGDVAEIVSGVTKGRRLNGQPARSVPYLAVINVQDQQLDLSVLKTIEATDEEIRRYSLRAGDLLLTEGGDPDKLGRGALWNGELPECIHQNHVFRVRIRADDVRPRFLSALLGSRLGKRYFLRSAKQTTGIASINMTQLRGCPILIPPQEVQREFERRLDAVDGLEKRTHASLAHLDALFASLQHRAFRGEL